MLQAVRREVYEEVGLIVGDVKIVGSQPWPAGRGGGCELMIGVIARASATDIVLNESEVRNSHEQYASRTCSTHCIRAKGLPDSLPARS